ncbi:MAG: hypothetical protein JXR97_04510, partial [Planctomycetes bacterium]|nr:hypothetical protein [Planctomycetota bacterium]
MARLRPVILILILTALAGYAASAENAKVCDHCKQVINGSYVVIKKGDKTFYLCKSCMERAKQSAPSCSLCGQKITGSYSKVERDGETIYFCGDCVKNAPRCKKCKIPIKAGQEVCARCARLLPTCTLCHKYITGSYKNFADGSRFCEDCEKLPRCDWCQHPYKPGTGIKLGGGTICP